MIAIHSDNVDKMLLYLDKRYEVEKKVYIHIVEGCDCIETPDGKGFGVFIPDKQSIYVATDIPDADINVPMTIAHEYMHFIQWCDGKPYDDEEAERFAKRVMCEIQLTRDFITEESKERIWKEAIDNIIKN